MQADAVEALRRLGKARSADEAAAICAAEAWMLDPRIDEGLRALERDPQYDQSLVDRFIYSRLQLQAFREGRNLRATYGKLLSATSQRTLRDLVVGEPLLLDPVFDRLMRRIERQERQRGDARQAKGVEIRRQFVEQMRDQGTSAGYFEWLVSALTTSTSPQRQSRIVEENRDLQQEFRELALERAPTAARLGDHVRSQQWLMALSLFSAADIRSSHSVEDQAFADEISELISYLLGDLDMDALRTALEQRPTLLATGVVTVVTSLLTSEMKRAALERDVVTLRDLWQRRVLIQRSVAVGPADALARWEAEERWPPRDETM